MSHKIQGGIKLFFTSLIFSYSYFWIALAVPYLSYRGLSGAQIFTLMSLYQLIGAILEYPTGILGDRYGYKRMLTIGNYLSGLSMLILIFSTSYIGYLFGLITLALASGFLSGNDMGMLSQISHQVKKDTANYHALSDTIFFLSAVVGGYLVKYIGYEWTLFVSGFLMTVANLPLNMIVVREKGPESNIVRKFSDILKDGLRSVRQPLLAQVILIASIFGGFTFTIKSIVGSYGDIYGIDVATVSLYIGLGGLARALGGKLYSGYAANKAIIPLLITAFLTLITGLASTATMSLNLILLLQVAIGYISSQIDGDMQEIVIDHVRSSVFSLKRLILRLVSSIILTIYGYAMDNNIQNLVILAIAIIMFMSLFFAKRYVSLKLDQK